MAEPSTKTKPFHFFARFNLEYGKLEDEIIEKNEVITEKIINFNKLDRMTTLDCEPIAKLLKPYIKMLEDFIERLETEIPKEKKNATYYENIETFKRALEQSKDQLSQFNKIIDSPLPLVYYPVDPKTNEPTKKSTDYEELPEELKRRQEAKIMNNLQNWMESQDFT